jgi:hypothetical protein
MSWEHVYLAGALVALVFWGAGYVRLRTRFPSYRLACDPLEDVLLAFAACVFWPLAAGVALLTVGVVLLKDRQNGAP